MTGISGTGNTNTINRSANAWGGEKDWATVLKTDNRSPSFLPSCLSVPTNPISLGYHG